MITIHALGDSLVTAYGLDENNFIGGWGDHLKNFLDESEVSVNVYAQGGRSSRSFLNEGRFLDRGNFTKDMFPYGMGPVCYRIQPGDYVMMQFGHNDDNSKSWQTYVDRMVPLGEPDENGIYPTVLPTEENCVPNRMPEEYVGLLREEGLSEKTIAACLSKYEEILPTYGTSYWSYGCGATYKGYLKFYIDNIRKMGATPILVTPAVRQYFAGNRIVAVPGHHGNRDAFGEFPYVRAVRQLGEEENVAVLDLFSRSKQLYEELGRDCAMSLHSIKDENGVTIGEARYDRPKKWVEEYDRIWRDHAFADVDDTHQNRLGSYLFAGILADCMKDAVPELAKWVLEKPTKKMSCPERIRESIPKLKAAVRNIELWIE